MPETWLHLLQDPLTRELVIKSIYELFKRWHIHPLNQAELLGLSDMSELEHYVSAGKESEVFERIGHLLAIDRVLVMLFPCQASSRNQWIWQEQAQLRNITPMALMLRQGVDGMKLIRLILQLQQAA